MASSEESNILCCLPGLEEFLEEELAEFFPGLQALRRAKGELVIPAVEPLEKLLRLRVLRELYRELFLPGRRPSVFLGSEAERKILDILQKIFELHQPESFSGFRISAAGQESKVLKRLRQFLSSATQLPEDPENGDLLFRLRKSNHERGWSLLVRVSPRPMSVRPWREYAFPGSLDPTLAAAMARSLGRTACSVVDPFCGAGTLCVEYAHYHAGAQLLGLDCSLSHLKGAQSNYAASQAKPEARFFLADARHIPLKDESCDALISNLPWGERVGRRGNKELYASFLFEARRILRANARIVLLSQDHQEIKAALPEGMGLLREWRVFQGG